MEKSSKITWKKAVSFMGILSLLLAGCREHPAVNTCEYEKIEECDMATILANDGKLYHITEQVKEHSVSIRNQKVAASDYEVELQEYFYNKNTGVALFKFMISGSEGETLTDEAYKKLAQIHEEGNLDLQCERSGRHFIDILQKAEGNHAVWYVGCLLSAIAPEDKISHITEKTGVNTVELYFETDIAGSFVLPDYDYQENAVSFDIPGQSSLISAQMTESGICMIWDIRGALGEFRAMIKELPDGENPESYHYEIYHTILIHMKDGTTHNVLAGYCDDEVREENNLASLSAIWDNPVSLEDVDYLEVDGVRYAPIASAGIQ